MDSDSNLSYFDRLLHFYQTVIEEAYELEAEFDKNKAKHLRKTIVQRDIQISKFIHDYETSLELVSFNGNIETEETIRNQLEILTEINTFNQTVIKIEVKTPVGFYMFIKDIIAYSHLLP